MNSKTNTEEVGVTSNKEKRKGCRYIITDGRDNNGIPNYYVNNMAKQDGINKAFFMNKAGDLLRITSTNSWGYARKTWGTPAEHFDEEMQKKAETKTH